MGPGGHNGTPLSWLLTMWRFCSSDSMDLPLVPYEWVQNTVLSGKGQTYIEALYMEEEDAELIKSLIHSFVGL